MHTNPSSFAPFFFAAGLAAQGFTVSPECYTTIDGNSATTVPFSMPMIHYQQVHGDLVPGEAWQISGIAFRREGWPIPTFTADARILDLQLCLGEARYDQVKVDFASNFYGVPTTVIGRTKIRLPNWSQTPTTPPAPFDLVLRFDAPMLFTAVDGLIWDLVVYGSTGPSYEMWADKAVPGGFNATQVLLSPGCISSGQTRPYELSGTITGLSGWEYRLFAQGRYAPPMSTFNYLLFGVADPAITYPWMCAPMHTSGEVVLTLPIADGIGSWSLMPLFFPASPYFAGADLFWQAASFDTGQPGLAITQTSAHKLTVPAIPADAPVRLKHLYEVSDLMSHHASVFQEGGLVTQFIK